MSILLQRLINCRYQRSLRVQFCFCYRAQSVQCIASPYVVLKTNSSSHAINETAFVHNSKACIGAGNLLKSVPFQKLNHSGIRYRLFHLGQCHVQPRQYYSTKKNVAVPVDEEKISPPEENTVDNKTIVNKIADARVKESRGDDVKTQITPSGPDVSSASIITPETSLTEVSKSTIDNKIGDEKLLSRLQRYLLWRFTWYLKRFQQSLENEMPDTFNMFRIFSIGLKDFVMDFKDFILVLIVISMPGSTLRSLSRREIELYYNMPGDMLRVFPILVISSVPLGQNIAFPIGYWFPKHLLCHHFWDLKQRHDFAMISLKKRLFNARAVFRSMQATLLTIEDKVDQGRCRAVFYKLGSGIHPTPAEIIAMLSLFQGYPFHISRIRMTHVNGLLRLHGKSVWLRRRRGLYDHARMLHYLDTAISREGIDSLNHDQLKASLFLRGVNPTNMSTKSMTHFLERWLTVSREVDASSYSLLLHLPILLAYNHPTNFVLIY